MKKKRFLAILITLVMIIGWIPATAFAKDNSAYDNKDIFLYLDGIEGEGKDPGHEQWIDLLTFMHGPSESQKSGSRGIFEPFTFKHLVDEATPKLQDYCMKGTMIKSGKVDFCRLTGEDKKVVYSVNFEGIKVTKARVETEDLPDGTFRLVEIVEIQVEKQTWTENAPLPDEFNSTVIEPQAPIGSTEIEKIRTLLDEYDRLAQNPAYKAQLDAVPGYGEWIAQLRIRLAELEGEERANADSAGSNLSPATGITGSKDDLFAILGCMGLVLVGLSVLSVRKRKE